MKRIVSMLLVLVPMYVFGVIAKPGSGVYGDEHYHYRLDEKGQVYAPVRERYTPIQQPQIASTFPTKGDVRSLVVLVNYADVKFVTPNPKQAFYDMLNQDGYSANGGTGSARDYFLQNSSNQFRPSFDVYGPVTLPRERAYYGGGKGMGTHHAQMIIDACDLLDGEIDWSQYDVNQDGEIDNIFVYYAGHNSAEGGPTESVWPHRGYVYTEKDGSYIQYYYEGSDGKKYWLWDYACTSELTGESGSYMCGIGTFCHEFSHVLGLSDLYNTQNSESYTVGTWDIMSSGNYNNDGRTPPSFSAFERFLLGWLTPVQLTREQDCILEPLATTQQAYLMSATEHNMDAGNPNPKEYWLLENRQRVGWDAPDGCLPGTGMLITHITWNKGRWDNNTPNNSRPMVYDICEAWYSNPYMSTPTDPFPGMFKISDFYPVANNKDTLFAHQLHSIQTVADINIAFHHGVPTGAGFQVSPLSPSVLHTSMVRKKVVRQEVQSFEVKGRLLQDSIVNLFISTLRFEISLDSLTWTQDTLRIHAAADSSCQTTVYVRYLPTVICQEHSGVLTVQTRDGVQFISVIVRGESSREVLIEPVHALEADQITPYAFTARWEAQSDAEQYALAVYRLEDYSSTLSMEPKFTLDMEHRDYLTDESLVPVTELQVNLLQAYDAAKSSYRAWVIVEGSNGAVWNTIDSIPVRAMSNAVQRTYTLSAEDDYRQFRLRYQPVTNQHHVTLSSVVMKSNKKPVYVGEEPLQYMEAPATEIVVSSLQPATDYYYYLLCSEEKGCEPHTTAKGNSVHVRTLAGTDKTDKQFTVINRQGQITAYLPDDAQEDSELGIYDSTGTLLFTVPVAEGENRVQIPATGLVNGQLYLVKYQVGHAVRRKGLWAKLLY